MRRYVLAIIVGLAGLAVGAAVIVLGRHAPPVAATSVLPPPAGEAVANLPPSAADDTATPAEAPPAAPAETATSPAASDLPTVDIVPHAVHTVPNRGRASPDRDLAGP